MPTAGSLINQSLEVLAATYAAPNPAKKGRLGQPVEVVLDPYLAYDHSRAEHSKGSPGPDVDQRLRLSSQEPHEQREEPHEEEGDHRQQQYWGRQKGPR